MRARAGWRGGAWGAWGVCPGKELHSKKNEGKRAHRTNLPVLCIKVVPPSGRWPCRVANCLVASLRVPIFIYYLLVLEGGGSILPPQRRSSALSRKSMPPGRERSNVLSASMMLMGFVRDSARR